MNSLAQKMSVLSLTKHMYERLRLGMLHDEDAGCRYGRGDRNLMTSSLSASSGARDWSPCSQRSLLAFIQYRHG